MSEITEQSVMYDDYKRHLDLMKHYGDQQHNSFQYLGAGVAVAIVLQGVIGAKPADAALFGFLAILAVVLLVALRDVMLRALLDYNLDQAERLESSLRDTLGGSVNALRSVENWRADGAKRTKTAAGFLTAAICLVSVVAPAYFLWHQEYHSQFVAYLFASAAALVVIVLSRSWQRRGDDSTVPSVDQDTDNKDSSPAGPPRP